MNLAFGKAVFQNIIQSKTTISESKKNYEFTGISSTFPFIVF